MMAYLRVITRMMHVTTMARRHSPLRPTAMSNSKCSSDIRYTTWVSPWSVDQDVSLSPVSLVWFVLGVKASVDISALFGVVSVVVERRVVSLGDECTVIATASSLVVGTGRLKSLELYRAGAVVADAVSVWGCFHIVGVLLANMFAL